MIKIALKVEPVIPVEEASYVQGVVAMKRYNEKSADVVGFVIRSSGGDKLQLIGIVGSIIESETIRTMPDRGVYTFDNLTDLMTAFPEYVFYQINDPA